MPKLSPLLPLSVFFLYRRHEKTGDIVGPCGTGFILERSFPLSSGVRHYYGVTNWHVACQTGASIIRINTKDGKSRFINLNPSEWDFKHNFDDLAVIDLTAHLDSGTDQFSSIGEFSIATEGEINGLGIGIGEDVFMIGLFARHHGENVNVPMARFGNLCLVADENALIRQENGVERPCHIVDVRSRTGFSGSPVFVYRIPTNDLSHVSSRSWDIDPTHNRFLKLLGVHTAQFGEPLRVEVSLSPERLGDPIKEGQTIDIPSSMATVVPGYRISELLEMPKLKAMREARDKCCG